MNVTEDGKRKVESEEFALGIARLIEDRSELSVELLDEVLMLYAAINICEKGGIVAASQDRLWRFMERNRPLLKRVVEAAVNRLALSQKAA